MTLSASDIPSTYLLPWPAVAGAYLQLLELGLEQDSVQLRSLLFFSGQYYSVLWSHAETEGKTNWLFPIHTEDDRLDKVCRMAVRRLNTLMKSRDTATSLAIEEEYLGQHPAPTWAKLLISLRKLEEVLQKTVRRWLEQEPVKENAVRFYFGLGIEAFIHGSALYFPLAREPIIALPGPKKTPAFQAIVKSHFTWSEERTAVRH